LILNGVVRKERLYVGGRVSSEEETTPMVQFVGRMGIKSMRPMGGGDSIVFGDGVILSLLVWDLNMK
jgi:hypothetical protein